MRAREVFSLAVTSSLLAAVGGGCSKEATDPTAPTSSTSDASTTPSSGALDGHPSGAGSSDAQMDVNGSGPTDNSTNSEATDSSADAETAGVVEPGVPEVLASEVVFGARLCLGAGNQLYYPNRIGYPLSPGLEQLWVVSRDGDNARAVGTPGSVTACVQTGNEVWAASYDTTTIARLDVESGALLPGYPTSGIPLQITGNSTHVFASLNLQSLGGEIVSIDPATLGQPQTLWSKPGRVTALWLQANDDRLLFSARDAQSTTAWIVQVRLSPVQVTELVAATGELGAVDGVGSFAYYTHYTNNEVRRVDVTSGANSLVTTIDHPWSLHVDGEYLYVGARPDYCANNEGRLYRVPLAGGDPTLLADNLNCPSQIVSDAKGLYWINTGSWQGPDSGESAPSDGSIMHLPRR